MIPTADDVAHIFVAACRETGENPLAIFDMKPLRARYYAHQAIIDVFGHPANRTARLIGYASKGTSFSHAIKHARAPGRGRPHRATWWSEDAMQAVTTVALDRRARRPSERPHAPIPRPAPAAPPRTPSSATRDPETIPAAEPPPRPRSSAPTFEIAPPRRRGMDLLADAVRNTIKITPPPED